VFRTKFFVTVAQGKTMPFAGMLARLRQRVASEVAPVKVSPGRWPGAGYGRDPCRLGRDLATPRRAAAANPPRPLLLL
jgi:hypothetical protein